MLSGPWLKKGFAVVSQDMRGRGDSEGNNAIIFHHNGWAKNTDGHDTIRWIAKQPWSDGNVGMWGGSALGVTQNMTAPGAPANLKAQWVLVAFSDFYSQCAYQGGVFRKELLEGWLVSQKIADVNLPTFVQHSSYDAFWEELNPESQAARVDCPAMFVGGWYDIFLQGTINSFATIQKQGGPRARGKCRLVIGPLAHRLFSELRYPNAGFPKEADPVRFYEHHLMGRDNGVDRDKPVRYYVMGDPTDKEAPGNYWRTADDWPPPSRETPFYFHGDGSLREREKPSGTDSKPYRYDPKDPVPTVGGQNLLIPAGPMDQRKVESRPDVLLFTSKPLETPLETTGRITARLFVASDCPDTDFAVKLCDVYPDGRSMLVTDGIVRARHRVSMSREDFLEPGETYELAVDLWSTSLIFHRGHRIRIAVTSSNSPRFEPNPNTGEPFRASEKTRVATNTIWLASDRPSHIVLPILSGMSEAKDPAKDKDPRRGPPR